MDITKLIEQAPYLAAIVVVVLAFLKSQALRDAAFLQAQSERDKVYLETQVQRDKIYLESQNAFATTLIALASQVGQMENVLIRHDAAERAVRNRKPSVK